MSELQGLPPTSTSSPLTFDALSQQPAPSRIRPLSLRAIVLGGMAMVLLAIALIVVLLIRGATSDQLEAIRTGGTLLVGGGGGFALWLAARRQRSTELDLLHKYEMHLLAQTTLVHQQRVADAGQADSTERRITDLYGKAADQLGSNSAASRMASIYALERLAEGHPSLRQTVVNLLCAYLRMPTFPGDYSTSEQSRELQVRIAIQTMLRDHFQSKTSLEASHWGALDIDLSGAVLHGFDMTDRVLRSADFSNASLYGSCNFQGCTFEGDAIFTKAKFYTLANFARTIFTGNATFNGSNFAGFRSLPAWQSGAWLLNSPVVAGFNRNYKGPNVKVSANFISADFHADATFKGALFQDMAWFNNSVFHGTTHLDTAKFQQGVELFRATILIEIHARWVTRGWPQGWSPDKRIERPDARTWYEFTAVDSNGDPLYPDAGAPPWPDAGTDEH